MWKCGLDSTPSGQSTVVGSCEHGNEHLSSIKNEGCFYLLSDYQLLKNKRYNVMLSMYLTN
jgi:hypothetical protein